LEASLYSLQTIKALTGSKANSKDYALKRLLSLEEYGETLR
jgi:hypothetical protein